MRLKKLCRMVGLSLALVLTVPTVTPAVANPVAVEAATVKISRKSATISVGDSLTLKVTGTSKTPKWTTSNKAVATVSKGKVTGKKAGTAKITATVDGKKYTSTIKVVKSSFKVKQVTFDGTTTVVPKDWDTQSETVQSQKVFIASPKTSSGESSNINMIVQDVGMDTSKTPYSEFKKALKSLYTKDFLSQQVESTISAIGLSGLKMDVTDFNTSDFKSKAGTAFKAEIGATVSYSGEKVKIKQTQYILYVKTKCLILTVSDFDDSKVNFDELAKLMLDNLTIK